MVIPDNLKPSLKSPVIIKAKTKVSIVPINLQDKLFAICLLLKYNSFFYFYRATLQVFFNVIILNFYSSGNHPLSNTVLFASTSHLIASCLLPTIAKSCSGTHPNFSFAFVGSPINKSTSVGLK